MKRSLKKCQRGLLVWYYSGPGRLGRRGGCRASADMSILKARRRRSRPVIADSQLEFRECSEEVVFSSGAVWSIQYIMWAYRAFSAFSSQRSIQLLSILPNTFFFNGPSCKQCWLGPGPREGSRQSRNHRYRYSSSFCLPLPSKIHQRVK